MCFVLTVCHRVRHLGILEGVELLFILSRYELFQVAPVLKEQLTTSSG